MNCSQCQDLLVEYSLGELEQRVADEVSDHLAGGCVECGRELVELKESLAMVGHSINPVPVPPRVKQDLLARIRSQRGLAGRMSGASETSVAEDGPATLSFPVQPVERRSWMSRALPFAAAVMVGFTVGALATQYFGDGKGAGANRAAQLAEMIEEARRSLGSPDVRFAALHAPQNADEVVGHLMWDARGRSLHLFAFDVTPPAPGQALVVWFETSTGKTFLAGELKLSERGACSEVFAAPHGSDEIAAVVVTEESDDSVTSPQGPQRIFVRFGTAAADADSE